MPWREPPAGERTLDGVGPERVKNSPINSKQGYGETPLRPYRRPCISRCRTRIFDSLTIMVLIVCCTWGPAFALRTRKCASRLYTAGRSWAIRPCRVFWPVRVSTRASPATWVRPNASSNSRNASSPSSLVIGAPRNSSLTDLSKPTRNASLRLSPNAFPRPGFGISSQPAVTIFKVSGLDQESREPSGKCGLRILRLQNHHTRGLPPPSLSMERSVTPQASRGGVIGDAAISYWITTGLQGGATPHHSMDRRCAAPCSRWAWRQSGV